MRHFIKVKRRGISRYELAFPENILRQNVHGMSKTQSRSLLVRLVLAEKRSRKLGGKKELWRFHSRLKKKRIEVTQYFMNLGGSVSPLILHSSLPSAIGWPGIVRLIETKGYEEWLMKRKV